MVAHSVGGYAARLTLVAFPQTRKFVRNIITLATPHDGLPFTLDRSVAKVIEKIKQTKMNDVTLVSICGGMRDEMIPPSTCFVNSSNAITVSR
jgi:triacylglycerol esterase/lipase EstA (alpha/beta hydrolase family)